MRTCMAQCHANKMQCLCYIYQCVCTCTCYVCVDAVCVVCTRACLCAFVCLWYMCSCIPVGCCRWQTMLTPGINSKQTIYRPSILHGPFRITLRYKRYIIYYFAQPKISYIELCGCNVYILCAHACVHVGIFSK